MNEYIEKGQAGIVTTNELHQERYLPHYLVMHPLKPEKFWVRCVWLRSSVCTDVFAGSRHDQSYCRSVEPFSPRNFWPCSGYTINVLSSQRRTQGLWCINIFVMQGGDISRVSRVPNGEGHIWSNIVTECGDLLFKENCGDGWRRCWCYQQEQIHWQPHEVNGNCSRCHLTKDQSEHTAQQGRFSSNKIAVPIEEL